MEIFKKLPGYYHKVADKYLKSHLKPETSNSRASLKSRMSKSHNYLPKIRNTGQGMLTLLLKPFNSSI